jgi:hypothetical protein
MQLTNKTPPPESKSYQYCSVAHSIFHLVVPELGQLYGWMDSDLCYHRYVAWGFFLAIDLHKWLLMRQGESVEVITES